jgi:transposase
LVCIENTGVYSEALCYALSRRTIPLALLNPRAVAEALPAGHKTDALDSRRIAEYGARYLDRLRPWTPRAEVVEQIRTLLATRERLVRQRTATQNARRALGRKSVQTPAANAALDATTAHLTAQIEAIMQAMRELIDQHPTMRQKVALLVTAPGVGELLASHLLVMTNGFAHEARYAQLASHLGISPRQHQSGTMRRRARSRGYGPALVRKLLHLAARSVRTHKAPFRRYFERKRAEGKASRLVLNNIANKLLRLLCAMLRRGEPYVEGYRPMPPRPMASRPMASRPMAA